MPVSQWFDDPRSEILSDKLLLPQWTLVQKHGSAQATHDGHQHTNTQKQDRKDHPGRSSWQSARPHCADTGPWHGQISRTGLARRSV